MDVTTVVLFVAGLGLLGLVLVTGDVAKGGQRWLDFGIRFQPSEVMKLAVPMTLAALLHEQASAQQKSNNPLAPKAPHFTPKAKAVIFLYMVGGPSQMETFDPKPLLDKMHGQIGRAHV